MIDSSLARRCAELMWESDHASKALGMEIESIAEGSACLQMTVRPDMVNGHQTCHGGMIFSLADSAFAFACNSQNHAAVASACNIDFIRPSHLGDRLTATAEMVHQGGRNGIYDVTVSNQKQVVIAKFRGRAVRLNRPVIEGEIK